MIVSVILQTIVVIQMLSTGGEGSRLISDVCYWNVEEED